MNIFFIFYSTKHLRVPLGFRQILTFTLTVTTDKNNLTCFQNGETPGSAETKKARIRGALEASGMAGNLTPDDIQTLKK